VHLDARPGTAAGQQQQQLLLLKIKPNVKVQLEMGLETSSLVSASIEDGAFEKENDFETKAFDDDDDTSSFSKTLMTTRGRGVAKYLCRKLILPPKGFSPPAQPPGVTAHAASATVAADAAAAADADAATDAAAEASNASGREACAWVETIAVAPLRAFEEGVGKRERTATTGTREAAHNRSGRRRGK
jgi:hypothetical protein